MVPALGSFFVGSGSFGSVIIRLLQSVRDFLSLACPGSWLLAHCNGRGCLALPQAWSVRGGRLNLGRAMPVDAACLGNGIIISSTAIGCRLTCRGVGLPISQGGENLVIFADTHVMETNIAAS